MIIPLNRSEQIVDKNGMMTIRATLYFEELTRIINLNTPIQGSGSPEGVITAEVSQRYMDTAGASEAVLYIKQTGTGNTGWILA